MKLEYLKKNDPRIPSCALLERKTLPTPWSEESIANMTPQGRYIVADVNDEVVGICSYYLVCDELELVNIAVADRFRKQGIGKAMMRKMLDESFSVCSLEVEEDNSSAISFYRSLGFKKSGKRKNFYKNKDAIIMILQKENEKC